MASPSPSPLTAAAAAEARRKSENCCSIEDLSEELLVEILHRLPTCESAVTCKHVSKRWYSLISHPYFVFRFLTKPNINMHHHSFTPMILCNNNDNFLDDNYNTKFENKFLPAEPNMITSSNFNYSLKFLPCYCPKRAVPISIMASHNNYLLCCSSDIQVISQQPVYYICDYLTGKWRALPTPPRRLTQARLGLICQPYYNYNKDCGVSYKFIVIRVCCPKRFSGYGDSDSTRVEIFSSESGQWSVSVVQGFRLNRSSTPAVAYNGVFHWLLAKKRGIIGFNIATTRDGHCVVDSCHYIPQPPGVCGPYKTFSKKMIGVSQGRLRMSVLSNALDLNVWELQNYSSGEWSLAHKVSIRDMFSDNNPPFVLQFPSNHWPWKTKPVEVLGFHPNDGDIVYVRFVKRVASCDMGRQKLELLTENVMMHPWVCTFFLFVIPWWSTPVPTLTGESNRGG